MKTEIDLLGSVIIPQEGKLSLLCLPSENPQGRQGGVEIVSNQPNPSHRNGNSSSTFQILNFEKKDFSKTDMDLWLFSVNFRENTAEEGRRRETSVINLDLVFGVLLLA